MLCRMPLYNTTVIHHISFVAPPNMCQSVQLPNTTVIIMPVTAYRDKMLITNTDKVTIS